MMEVHDARGRTHEFGPKQQIERQVGLEMIEQKPQQPLRSKARI
jgi:hypothetical protein